MPKANDRIGLYQLIRKLGEGGFGEVWLAQDFSGSTPREVAVKMPLAAEIDLDALLQEATLWARATGHANVLEFLAARVFDGQVVLVSEYAPDGSLKDWLKLYNGRAPSVEAAVKMTRGILAGLEHLHGRNIIHRDVKPDNVLLLGATPRLADFGISRVLKSTSKSAVTAGTPPYMAPEAFNRKRNQQTDLWSVGVILYQMLSGRLPFDGNDMAELYGAILNEEPEPLPATVPEWLRQVITKALIKDPEQRYQMAAEMRAALTPGPPIVKQKTAPPPHRIVTIDKPPPKREPTVTKPPPPRPKPIVAEPESQHTPIRRRRPVAPTHDFDIKDKASKPVRPSRLSLAAKWRAGLVAVVIALATYLAPSPSSPSFLNPPGTTQLLPDLGDAFTENPNGVNLQMKRVPGGFFTMGSPESEQRRYPHEGPQHPVTVPSFYIGKYEVTQAQWKAVMGSGNNPSYFKGDDLPVETVTWNDAKGFCRKLSGMTGKTYGLPSEAEWEYACRARTTGAFAGNLDVMAWYSNNSDSKTHPVGQKQANAFGLFDMHGNVWEWCEDVWHENYNDNPPTNGSAWLSGGDSWNGVLRGGSWYQIPNDVRSARRSRDYLGGGGDNGLRVVASARTQ